MKTRITIIFLALLGLSCSSTHFVDRWKNEEIGRFSPVKLLIVGMTENLTTRRIFEENLKREFLSGGSTPFRALR
jgi:hypothetical protein